MAAKKPVKKKLCSFKLSASDIALLNREAARAKKRGLTVSKAKLVRFALNHVKLDLEQVARWEG